ncbi:sporulation protein YqfD [Roseburia hominis]
MLIALLRYLTGYLRIQIRGYSPERFLNLCSHHGIYLWDLMPADGAYEMNISVKGFRRLRPIVRKTQIRVAIKERRGLPFFLHKYRKRKLFFAGGVLCLGVIYFLSFFIWNIHIEGNQARTDETILEFLEEQGITHGMPKSGVDCQQIVKDIRKEYDDIIWVSAHIKGTRLLIQVKENSDTITEPGEEVREVQPVDLVASEDGVILELITRKGVPQVHEGDEVKKGDLLVAGNVPVLNDAGEIIDYQYHEADARIVAKTQMTYQDLVPLTYEKKNWTGKKRYRFFLSTPKKLYKIIVPGTSFPHSVREVRQFTPRIGEHFYLPFTLGWEVVREYRPEEKKYTDDRIQEQLTLRFQKFCQNLEKKGVQILQNDVKIYKESKQASAKGILILSQEIGKASAANKKTADVTDAKEEQEGN